MAETTYRTAREMLADLAAKRISARELLDAHIARNEKIHGRINAVVESDIARAMKDAARIDDARVKDNALGTLAGLPMTIKDGLDVEGMPATAGNPHYAHRDKNCADATVVAAARRAGAVIWGKTNVPHMLSDFQSYNDIYGTTNNPYDVTRVPGGSSGGAAAALACGATPLEIGSDIGGSLRHPANFCGVYALKPTWGVLSMRGQVPPPPDAYVETDLNVTGPMARDAEDLRLLYGVLREAPVAACRDVKAMRIAVWDEENHFPLAAAVKEAVARAADGLRTAGCVVERAKPAIDGMDLYEAYNNILKPIIATDFPDEMFDMLAAKSEEDRRNGVTYDPDSFDDWRMRATVTYREVQRAGVIRQRLKDCLAEFFRDWDAILMPISPVVAFPHMQQPGFTERKLDVDGRLVPYPSMLKWISLATALHAPAIAVPAGQTDSGLPTGVQMVGHWHGEDRLFDLASALAEEIGGFTPPAL